ncbi:MAG: isoleucine--tRNA ligase, partial [Verrucomicrobia bacterium 21-51-4]
MKPDLKDTLNLPKTDFPMRASLVEREPKRIAHWEAMGLYSKIQQKNAAGEAFVLHDGPPFTNGDIHVGTAFNKILKDITLRYQSMRGKRTPFVPGWDCHGLPIEHKVSRELEEQKKTLDPVSLRQACKKFSESYIERQGAQFKRLGVMGEWANDYRTMNPAYEADILRGFSKFVETNQVYRSKKPVYWSIPCHTALAEGEVEYQDHTSTALWVKFDAVNPADFGLKDHAAIVIWTTTPWTLPANLAIAIHPEHSYVALAHLGRHYIVGQKLAEDFAKRAQLEGATVVKTWTGRELEGKLLQHPFINRT